MIKRPRLSSIPQESFSQRGGMERSREGSEDGDPSEEDLSSKELEGGALSDPQPPDEVRDWEVETEEDDDPSPSKQVQSAASNVEESQDNDDDGGEEEEEGHCGDTDKGQDTNISIKMEVDTTDYNNEDNSSSGSFTDNNNKDASSSQDVLDTYLRLLERDCLQLNTLMVLKEQEWDSILKLKKLKEIKIAKMKRKRAVDDVSHKLNNYHHNSASSRLGNILSEDIKLVENVLGARKRGAQEVRHNIQRLDKEINEIMKDTFGDTGSKVKDGNDLDTSSLDGSAFSASNALKSLAKSSVPIDSSPSLPTPPDPRIIGAGRQGPKLNVTSLIADYRTKARENPELLEKDGTKWQEMDFSGQVSFTKMLGKLSSQLDKERDSNNGSPPATNAKIVQPTSKSSKSSSSAAANKESIAIASKSSGGGTTLAKLLSSNNGTSRCLDDSFSFNHHKSSNNVSSDKSLSLANLLASSKSRDEVQKKKPEAATAAVPVCQGCHANKAQFVCAGCANQWYCSRECQVAAWEEHSELCSA